MENINKQNTRAEHPENQENVTPEKRSEKDSETKNKAPEVRDPEVESAPSADMITNTGDDDTSNNGDADAATG